MVTILLVLFVLALIPLGVYVTVEGYYHYAYKPIEVPANYHPNYHSYVEAKRLTNKMEVHK